MIPTGAVLAATTIFNLGKPTNAVSTNQHFPLSGFHDVKGLQPPGKIRVLFIGVLTFNVGSYHHRHHLPDGRPAAEQRLRAPDRPADAAPGEIADIH